MNGKNTLIKDIIQENSINRGNNMRNKQMEVVKLKEENTKLQIALCNLRDEFLDLGGDVNQLELFDKDDVSQLKIFESPDGGETIYQRNAGSDERIKISD